MSKYQNKKARAEQKKWEIINKSKVFVKLLNGTGQPDTENFGYQGFYMKVTGPAANIPSVSNNRQMSVQTYSLESLLKYILKNPRNAYTLARKALNELNKIRPRITHNVDHVARIKALTVLYEQEIGYPPVKLLASKTDPWVFFCFISNFSNRTDSHNIPKALCDWMEDVGLIENDLYIDMGCWRKKHLSLTDLESLEVIGAPYRHLGSLICQTKDSIFSIFQTLSKKF